MMTEEAILIDEKKGKFSDAVKAVGGIDVSYCYQCGKCATGCPVAYEMDLTPTQLMHAIQLGLKDVVYKSKTMWLCAACQTCSTRCPQNVDIAEVLDSVKILMQRNRKKPLLPDVLKFNKTFVENLKWFGRLYEIGMIAILTLRTRKLSVDMGMGMKMFKKHKVKIFPGFKGAQTVRKILSRVKKQEKA
jgi:heterodisulfide reductase subunit C